MPQKRTFNEGSFHFDDKGLKTKVAGKPAVSALLEWPWIRDTLRPRSVGDSAGLKGGTVTVRGVSGGSSIFFTPYGCFTGKNLMIHPITPLLTPTNPLRRARFGGHCVESTPVTLVIALQGANNVSFFLRSGNISGKNLRIRPWRALDLKATGRALVEVRLTEGSFFVMGTLDSSSHFEL